MRNYKKYRAEILTSFKAFLEGVVSKEYLLDNLNAIELELIRGRKTLKSLWFRFHNHDPIATTVRNIERDIESSTNNAYIKKSMQLAIESPKGFKVHFS